LLAVRLGLAKLAIQCSVQKIKLSTYTRKTPPDKLAV
jgi:hypothetical protein